MGVFDINGKFFKTLTKAGDFIILTLLAMVCSIPVITIGASLTAVFYAALKMARDEEGYVWKEFFKSFKQNLKQSILIELIRRLFFTRFEEWLCPKVEWLGKMLIKHFYLCIGRWI